MAVAEHVAVFELPTFPILQSVATLTGQITVTEIKDSGFVEDVASSCQPETLSTGGKRTDERCHERIHACSFTRLF